MKSLRLILIMVLSMTVVSAVFAGDKARNAVEKAQDRQDIRQERRAVADDKADLDRLSNLIIEYNHLASTGASASELHIARDRIASELRRDLAENNAQLRDAKREQRQSKREIRSDRRELRKDREAVTDGDATPKEKHELRDDRRDRRDDRRDFRDDRRDAERAERLLNKKREITADLRKLQNQIDIEGPTKGLLAKQSKLFDKYLETSRMELSMGLRELKEDKRELREDRRESREDRRQEN